MPSLSRTTPLGNGALESLSDSLCEELAEAWLNENGWLPFGGTCSCGTSAILNVGLDVELGGWEVAQREKFFKFDF